MSKKPSLYLSDQLRPFIAPFRFDGSGEFHLKLYKTNEKGGLDKDRAEKILEANRKGLSDFQEKLYAQDRWSLLLIFQGMDAAGKDSAIKCIFAGVNPQGCEVHAFKQPSPAELDHDFMWRCMIALPSRGRIGIFNRSYYEECLVTRVHRELLAKEEQRERFLDRLDEPAKNWKFSMADIAERALWNRYQAVYQDIVRHTSSAVAPWYVVPADHKWFARVVIGSAIVSTLDTLNLRFPRADQASLQEFKEVRKALLEEGRKKAEKKVAAGKVANK